MSPQRTISRLVASSAVLITVVATSCQDAPSEPKSPARVIDPRASGPSLGALAGDLPSTDTVTSSVPAFEIRQKGGGIAGRFEITNPNSGAIALDGVTSGTGHALLAWNLGLGRGAVVITSNSQNTLPALDVSSQSLGGGRLAAALDVRANNPSATAPAASISTGGMGPVLRLNHTGTTGDLAELQVNGTTAIRFDRNGTGYFTGGTKSKGADVAEAFAVEGRPSHYEPGDVLVVSTRTDRTLEKAAGAYSTHVVGVYATRPGVLLTESDLDSLGNTVPLGVIGVIPTKVTLENGAIRRGDLVVTARTPGHAMRGTDRRRMVGATIGKALEEFRGPGTGVIRVLVNVR